MVRAESRPISGDTGLTAIEKRTSEYLENPSAPTGTGKIEDKDCYDDFIAHLLRIVDPSEIKPMKVLADPGNGAAGIALKKLLPYLPLEVTLLREEPDGNFPNGVPNPILEESREMTEKAMQAGEFSFGVAWDGDYDRCFFFDGKGNFIEGYYIVGLLAQAILKKDPNHTIIYDPRLTWNTLDIVQQLGGRAVVCKSGHAFIKEKMRAEDAIYGGEMSAHHYFKDHWYCDSGMIPFLLVARLITHTGRHLGDLVGEMIENYPCSGEINSSVQDVGTVLKRVEAKYSDGKIDHIDGLSVEYPEWRFNLRGSNTEPVIRLNVEARNNKVLMDEKTQELLAEIRV
jgi:phosphomannomutase